MSKHRHKERFTNGLLLLCICLGFSYLGAIFAIEVGQQWTVGAIGVYAFVPVAYVLGTVADLTGMVPDG